jgi:transglutaminase-like putative cysteine protease
MKIKRLIFLLLPPLLPVWMHAQEEVVSPTLPAYQMLPAAKVPDQPDYVTTDAYARSLHFRGESDIIRITDSLTGRFSTDLEKARAIFVWITGHIAYDCGKINRLKSEPEEVIHPLYYTQYQLANIMQTRRTRCDGYSFLFKLMCRLTGVYATVVEGYAKFEGEKVDPATVEPNHAWNAVCCDGIWFETDLTAAAGQCLNGSFQRGRRDEFFQMNEKTLERLYIPVTDHRTTYNSGRVVLKF